MTDASPPERDEPAWIDGDPALRQPLVAVFARGALAGHGVEVLRERAGRRRLLRVRLPDGTDCFVKHYLRGDRHRLREWWKRRLGLTDEEHGHVREGYTLDALHELLAPHFAVTEAQTYNKFFSECVDVVVR